jgi:DNA-binding CsgD family transcriptional regulator
MSLGFRDGDVRALLHLVRPADRDNNGPVLPWSLLHELRELIACDNLQVYGQDTPRQDEFASQDLPGNNESEVNCDAYWPNYWDSPCAYPDLSGDLQSVTMISDFCTQRQWHATGMYNEYLGLIDVEHEIKVCLPAGPGRTLRFLFARGRGPDFDERDRAILTLLRPHLHAAYLAAERLRLGVSPLTPRQQEVMQYVAAGFTNAQIARRMRVSEGTVRKHLENVFGRLGVTSRTAAIGRAGVEPFAG